MTETAAPRCPWCSAVLERADAATCPSCGANLLEPTGVSVPGVTAIDAEALARRHSELRAPSGIVGMLSGDDTGAPSEAELPALAPPDEAVRREMLRMELDAQLATLTAEAHAVAAERGVPLEELETGTEGAEGSGDAPGEAADSQDGVRSGGQGGPAGASGAPPAP